MKKILGFSLLVMVALTFSSLIAKAVYSECKIRTDKKYVDGCSGPWLPNVHVKGINIDAKKLFKPACNTHDQCYHSCGCGKEHCDDKFKADMTAICDKNYPYDPITIGTGRFKKNIGDKNAVKRTACYAVKDAFYAAVRAGGQSSYDNAQKRAGCKDKVCLYQHWNYKGIKKCWSVGQRQSSLTDIGFNDMASSVKVFGNAKVEIYEHVGFKGKKLVITSDTPKLGKAWNDKASSLKIIRP